jgi:hypothetical protein
VRLVSRGNFKAVGYLRPSNFDTLSAPREDRMPPVKQLRTHVLVFSQTDEWEIRELKDRIAALFLVVAQHAMGYPHFRLILPFVYFTMYGGMPLRAPLMRLCFKHSRRLG